jgi:hypothetical protein
VFEQKGYSWNKELACFFFRLSCKQASQSSSDIPKLEATSDSGRDRRENLGRALLTTMAALHQLSFADELRRTSLAALARIDEGRQEPLIFPELNRRLKPSMEATVQGPPDLPGQPRLCKRKLRPLSPMPCESSNPRCRKRCFPCRHVKGQAGAAPYPPRCCLKDGHGLNNASRKPSMRECHCEVHFLEEWASNPSAMLSEARCACHCLKPSRREAEPPH